MGKFDVLYDLKSKLDQADIDKDYNVALDAISTCYDIDNISYLGLMMPKLCTEEPFSVNSYKKSWVENYLSNEYLSVDLVIKDGLVSILPLDWAILQKKYPKTKTFFQDANGYGIGNNGITIPIRGMMGEFALFSVSINASNKNWEIYRKELLPELNMLSFYFHEMVMRGSGLVEPLPHLSPRETEVIKWLSNGKTKEDISDILCLSYSTIKHYTETARTRLGALNSSHAVAKAISRGIIPPPE